MGSIPFFFLWAFSFVAIFFLFFPQIIFDFRHDFLISKAVLAFFSGKNTSLGSQQAGLFGRFLIRMGSLWEDYFLSSAFVDKSLIATLSITVPALLGWWVIFRKRDSVKLRFAAMLLLIIISVYLGFTIYPGPVWVWYRSGMPIVFILLAVLGWIELIQKNKRWKWLAIAIFTTLAFLGTQPKKLVIRALGKDEGGVVSIRNQKHVLDIIFKDANDNPFDLYVYTPPVYTYVWDHILFWYAEPKYGKAPVDYGYQRNLKATNNFYLLIEPDNIPVRIDGWKGNFVSHGEPIKKWLLPGDIKVEKWQAIDSNQSQQN